MPEPLTPSCHDGGVPRVEDESPRIQEQKVPLCPLLHLRDPFVGVLVFLAIVGWFLALSHWGH
jgi:hypothetical protein